jgi:lantibiotic biosynthesis dehydratase-like protein
MPVAGVDLPPLGAEATESGRPLLLLRIAALPFETLAPLAAPAAVAALDAWLDLEAALDAEAARLNDRLFAAAGPGGGESGEGEESAAARRAIIALRRAVHNRRAIPPALVAEAAPRLGPELSAGLLDHAKERRRLAAAQAAYEAAFRADLARARGALVALTRRPIFQEGIRLVGRSLLGRLAGLARADPARVRHDERHAAAKATAYAARFATKTSPNSVFCAVALAEIAGIAGPEAEGEARVEGENVEARRDVLLSIAEARKVAACLAADRAAWPAVVPRPNPTLRPEGRPESRVQDQPGDPAPAGAYTFWRPSTPRRDDDDEVLSRVRAQPVLDLFLEEAARGTLAVPDLLAAVAARSGLEVEALAEFLARLAEAGILIVELEPPYNARRPLAELGAMLAAAGCDPPWRAEIETIERAVDGLAALSVPARLEKMDGIAARLETLPHRRPLVGDALFRVDTATSLAVTLPAALLEELRGAVGRYVRLFAAMYPEPVFRRDWGARFLSRFPADRDVPLLDLYHGLFEPENEARPALFPEAPHADPAAVAVAGRVRDLLAEKAREAAASGAEEVALDDRFFAEAGALAAEPAWAAGVLFQVAARDAAAVSAGSYRLAVNAFFGAGIALARFAWLLGDPAERGERGEPGVPDDHREPSPAIVQEVARYAAPPVPWRPAPASPGAAGSPVSPPIVAEITYNHLARSANAGLRPTIFRHEIELPGERASPGAEAIPLADLTVRWDGAGERFVLRSLSRGVEVVPVISSGISPEGFVAFLVQVGRQGLQPLAHFPGFDVPGVTRWPRFTFGRLVLFRRRWVFAPGEGPVPPETARDAGDAAAADFFARLWRWRRAHGLPRHVFLHTDSEPKPYYADLDSPLSAELLRRTLTPAPGEPPPVLHATEMLPGPDELWVCDRAGRYASEFLVQFSG